MWETPPKGATSEIICWDRVPHRSNSGLLLRNVANQVTGNSSPWQDSSSLNHWGTPGEATGSGAYWQSQGTDMEDDSGTERDTSSDSGHEEIDVPDLNGLNQSEASAHAYWQYRLHKRKWRRLSSKPTRMFRRIHKRFRTAKGKGKGFLDMP